LHVDGARTRGKIEQVEMAIARAEQNTISKVIESAAAGRRLRNQMLIGRDLQRIEGRVHEAAFDLWTRRGGLECEHTNRKQQCGRARNRRGEPTEAACARPEFR